MKYRKSDLTSVCINSKRRNQMINVKFYDLGRMFSEDNCISNINFFYEKANYIYSVIANISIHHKDYSKNSIYVFDFSKFVMTLDEKQILKQLECKKPFSRSRVRDCKMTKKINADNLRLIENNLAFIAEKTKEFINLTCFHKGL